MVSLRIAAIKRHQLETRKNPPVESASLEANGSNTQPDSQALDVVTPQEDRLSRFDPSRGRTENSTLTSTGLGWLSLVGQGALKSQAIECPYLFSIGFLTEASMAFANAREAAEVDTAILSERDFSKSILTRNKIHVMSAITMLLQKQHADIVANNAHLSECPVNERQFHAARYRRSQLRILLITINSVISALRRLTGLEANWPQDLRIVRLEDILRNSPRNVLVDFRAMLHIGFGTRNPIKIKENMWVESAFALWLCGLWLWHSSNLKKKESKSDPSEFASKISQWLFFLEETYGRTREGLEAALTKAGEEELLLAESCHSIIKAAAVKNSRSLYNNPGATVERLLWCIQIIREEGFMCPDLEGRPGDEHDEFMLFLEIKPS